MLFIWGWLLRHFAKQNIKRIYNVYIYEFNYIFFWKTDCEDCHELFENSCPQHPLTVIENTPVTKGCRDHAKRSLPDGLIVKEASIKNAGLGVWAEKAFPKGVRFGHYGGEIVGEEEGRESGYAWEVSDL